MNLLVTADCKLKIKPKQKANRDFLFTGTIPPFWITSNPTNKVLLWALHLLISLNATGTHPTNPLLSPIYPQESTKMAPTSSANVALFITTIGSDKQCH